VVERWVDTEQTRRLLEQASEGKRKHILAYRYLGLSWSELYRIAEPDVDRRAWLVRVRGTKTKDRDRLVPLAAHVRHVFAPGFHFEKWDYGNGNRDMTNWARAAGVVGEGERFSFNDLRRSFATELVRAGVSTKIVAELMGHVDEKMVNRVYARVAVGAHMSAAVAKLESP
jgi:integrase